MGSFYGFNKEDLHPETLEMDSDEPPILAGEDFSANLLNALASCLTTTLVYHTAIRGIKINELESYLEGNIDPRGFLGLSNEVRRGYENIRVNFKVKTDTENLKKLKVLSKLSPVFDITSSLTLAQHLTLKTSLCLTVRLLWFVVVYGELSERGCK